MQRTFFDNVEDLKKWKRDIERERMSQFVKHRGSARSETKCIDSYYCNRSAKGSSPRLVPPHERKRAERLKGTSKISTKCTCFMRVTHIKENGKVMVEYCLEHMGHEIELCHLKLSPELRSLIAAKLASGVEIGKIVTFETKYTALTETLYLQEKTFRISDNSITYLAFKKMLMMPKVSFSGLKK